MDYNKNDVSEMFERGKYLLDRGYYNEAIEVFNKLIQITDPVKDTNQDARVNMGCVS